MTQDRAHLETSLGYSFKNPALLNQALTHRSAGKIHNERFEFLGDAILDLVIAERLFVKYPQATEGELSRMRANLVNGEVLADIATELGLGQHLQLGTGERKSGGKRRVSILADAVEAIIAAIYLDGGLSDAGTIIDRLFAGRIASKQVSQTRKDSKTRLQELMQAQGLPLPTYDIREVTGEAHNQTFTVECRVDLLEQPQLGTGKSKRIAEQEAANQVLAIIESQS